MGELPTQSQARHRCDGSVHSTRLLLLYGFFVIKHGRRHIVHFNATFNPTASWVMQQLREAFPYDTAPRYLIFDRDAIFSPAVVKCVRSFGIEPIRISYLSPWQNGTAERWILSCRRELPRANELILQVLGKLRILGPPPRRTRYRLSFIVVDGFEAIFYLRLWKSKSSTCSRSLHSNLVLPFVRVASGIYLCRVRVIYGQPFSPSRSPLTAFGSESRDQLSDRVYPSRGFWQRARRARPV